METDKDKSGYIDRKELKQMIFDCFGGDIIDSDSLEESFNEIDKNGDGKINFEGFIFLFLITI
jgi:Ca2+-binding EF-hand superfamily protein